MAPSCLLRGEENKAELLDRNHDQKEREKSESGPRRRRTSLRILIFSASERAEEGRGLGPGDRGWQGQELDKTDWQREGQWLAGIGKGLAGAGWGYRR